MNRQQRRKAIRAKPAYLRESPEEIKRRLVRNGITAKDLEDNYRKGMRDAQAQATIFITKSCYAAVCLALNELHGFGAKRCEAVLRAADQHMIYSLTSEELIDEVWERIKLRISFDEPFDRIEGGT